MRWPSWRVSLRDLRKRRSAALAPPLSAPAGERRGAGVDPADGGPTTLRLAVRIESERNAGC
jgi:hypothetical protein